MAKGKKKKNKGGGGGGNVKVIRTPPPQVIVTGAAPAPAKRSAPRKSGGSRGGTKTMKTITQTASTVAGAGAGGGSVYLIDRYVEKETPRIVGKAAVAAAGLLGELVGAATNCPHLSHASAAAAGAGLGGIASEVGSRHRREAAAKGTQKSNDGVEVGAPGDRIRRLLTLLADRLAKLGADPDEVSGYCGGLIEDHKQGALPADAVADAILFLQEGDLAAGLAALDDVPFEEVDTAGPLEWARRQGARFRANRERARADREKRRSAQQAAPAARHQQHAALTESVSTPQFRALVDPAVQARIDQALAY